MGVSIMMNKGKLACRYASAHMRIMPASRSGETRIVFFFRLTVILILGKIK